MNKSLAILLLGLGIISLSDCMARRGDEDRTERCSRGCHIVKGCQNHACRCDKEDKTDCRAGKCECKPCGCAKKAGYKHGKEAGAREVRHHNAYRGEDRG